MVSSMHAQNMTLVDRCMLTSNAIRMHGWAHVAAFLPLMLYGRLGLRNRIMAACRQVQFYAVWLVNAQTFLDEFSFHE